MTPEVPAPFASFSPSTLCSVFVHEGRVLGVSRALAEFLRIAPQAIHDLPLESVLLDLPPQSYDHSSAGSDSSVPLLCVIPAKLQLPPYEASLAQPQVLLAFHSKAIVLNVSFVFVLLLVPFFVIRIIFLFKSLPAP